MPGTKRKWSMGAAKSKRRSAWTKTYKRARSSTSAPATRTSVARLTNMVRAVRPELKCRDYTLGSTGFDYVMGLTHTNHCVLVNNMPVSDGMDGRNGRKVFIKSFQMRLQFRLPQPSMENELAQSLRIVVLWDKGLNAAYPPGSTGSPTSTVAIDSLYFKGLQDPETSILSPLNLDFRDRVVILSDDLITSSPTAQNLANYKKYLRVNRETIFNAGTGALSFDTIVSGALIVCLIANRLSNNTAETAPRIAMNCRTRYTDA